MYATGTGPLLRIESLRLHEHEHGFQRAQILKPPQAYPPLRKLPYHVKRFDARNIDVDSRKKNSSSTNVDVGGIIVPSVETTYWCRLIRLPNDFNHKTHIVQYEPIIQSGSESLVHHMELFHCELNDNIQPQPPLWNGKCTDPSMPPELKTCKRVIAAWAMGAPPMIYPGHVGLPIGGVNYSLFVMLEIHYNNPEHLSNMMDTSGIRLYYTHHLRPVDAGIIEIGLEYTDKNSIPPGSIMELDGYCVSECTRASLPRYGIKVFASQLHTHLTGVASWTRHIRGGLELPELNRDNHYSPHFQEIRRLPRTVTVFPGDALIHVCRYNTMDRSNITLGGFGIRDEMCVNYMHYYPKTNLEVCKSSIDNEYLNRYFDRMHREEWQNTSRHYSVSDNYRNIEWNSKRTKELDSLYRTSPLSMQCNQSSGERFPVIRFVG